MPISYKHKIYTTLGTPTVLSGDVVSATDNAGVPAKDYTVKGKTIVWNQLFDKNSIPNRNSTAITYSVDGNINILTTTNVIATSHFNFLCSTVSGHKYMICARSLEWNSPNHSNLFIGDSGNPDTASYATLTPSDLAKTFTATNETCYIKSYISYSAGNYEFKMNGLQLFDLTQMFGAGNEPATPEEFWQRVPEKLYGYNPSAYKFVNIPSSKYFPDGMRSAGSAYDEINFLSQKAIKRIGVVDMGTLDWGSNPGTYPTNSFYSIDFHDAKGDTRNIISNGKFNNIYANNGGMIIAITDSDEKYDSSEAFKAAMAGVMLYYELATPVETEITPPLQALSTFKGFTSFSAPNSLTQNGPLSVTYYAEGGVSPESGWLTSYKRKLYMGRNIEWNQLFINSRTSAGTITLQNQNGIITINGTSGTYYINFDDLSDAMNQTHSYLFYLKILNNPDNLSLYYGWLNRGYMLTTTIADGEACVILTQPSNYITLSKNTGISGFTAGTVFNNVKIAVMVMDLTQMFGAGNEPATPEEFWSYFDHKLYPYNPGETQPLFKISRKSQWGSI
jgi:hypothetical protein|nr:MAG TPA: hypothetical protein [Caudoviricetes sp.]